METLYKSSAQAQLAPKQQHLHSKNDSKHYVEYQRNIEVIKSKKKPQIYTRQISAMKSNSPETDKTKVVQNLNQALLTMHTIRKRSKSAERFANTHSNNEPAKTVDKHNIVNIVRYRSHSADRKVTAHTDKQNTMHWNQIINKPIGKAQKEDFFEVRHLNQRNRESQSKSAKNEEAQNEKLYNLYEQIQKNTGESLRNKDIDKSQKITFNSDSLHGENLSKNIITQSYVSPRSDPGTEKFPVVKNSRPDVSPHPKSSPVEPTKTGILRHIHPTEERVRNNTPVDTNRNTHILGHFHPAEERVRNNTPVDTNRNTQMSEQQLVDDYVQYKNSVERLHPTPNTSYDEQDSHIHTEENNSKNRYAKSRKTVEYMGNVYEINDIRPDSHIEHYQDSTGDCDDQVLASMIKTDDVDGGCDIYANPRSSPVSEIIKLHISKQNYVHDDREMNPEKLMNVSLDRTPSDAMISDEKTDPVSNITIKVNYPNSSFIPNNSDPNKLPTIGNDTDRMQYMGNENDLLNYYERNYEASRSSPTLRHQSHSLKTRCWSAPPRNRVMMTSWSKLNKQHKVSNNDNTENAETEYAESICSSATAEIPHLSYVKFHNSMISKYNNASRNGSNDSSIVAPVNTKSSSGEKQKGHVIVQQNHIPKEIPQTNENSLVFRGVKFPKKRLKETRNKVSFDTKLQLIGQSCVK